MLSVQPLDQDPTLNKARHMIWEQQCSEFASLHLSMYRSSFQDLKFRDSSTYIDNKGSLQQALINFENDKPNDDGLIKLEDMQTQEVEQIEQQINNINIYQSYDTQKQNLFQTPFQNIDLEAEDINVEKEQKSPVKGQVDSQLSSNSQVSESQKDRYQVNSNIQDSLLTQTQKVNLEKYTIDGSNKSFSQEIINRQQSQDEKDFENNSLPQQTLQKYGQFQRKRRTFEHIKKIPGDHKLHNKSTQLKKSSSISRGSSLKVINSSSLPKEIIEKPASLDLSKQCSSPLYSGLACSRCGTRNTPAWRKGPEGPKSLCNACGVRYMKDVTKKK